MRIKSAIAIFVIGSILIASGCHKSVDPSTISDIAYDVNPKFGYTVYVMENEEYVPYLVPTADYSGGTLLLRKDLLAEPHKYGYGNYFNETSPSDYYNDSGYYATSNIDRFLNEEFYYTLSASVQKQILVTTIGITSEHRVETNGLFLFDTDTISRKIFLLSHTELGLPASELAENEGKPLNYFQKNSIIAYHNDTPSSYWLRTRYTWESNMAWGVGPEGTIGGGDTKSYNGVRLAFCLPNTAKITQRDGLFFLGEIE